MAQGEIHQAAWNAALVHTNFGMVRKYRRALLREFLGVHRSNSNRPKSQNVRLGTVVMRFCTTRGGFRGGTGLRRR
jgi:hypothetical protein